MKPATGGVLGTPPRGGSVVKPGDRPGEYIITHQLSDRMKNLLHTKAAQAMLQTAKTPDPRLPYPDGNPKTAVGAKKPDLTVIPQTAILHCATAMMNGADKYGPYNWREQPISTRPYIAAAQRHLAAFLDGEDYSADTVEAGAPVHHLAHVMACCAILLDAMEVGTLNENRPVQGRAGIMIEQYNRDKRFGLT